MDVYSTEEEQIESIKKWWKENGRSVIAGVVLGLGGVLGWQGWQAHTERVAGEASVQFNQLLQTVQTENSESAGKQSELIISEYDGTTYAVFAALSDARVKVKEGDIAAARARLEWVIANASDSVLQEVARLRLARMLLSEGDLDGAAKLAAESKVKSYAGEYAELEGDIATARDDRKTAAEAYRRALENDVANKAMVQMKLNDLAVDVKVPSAS